MKHSLNIEEWHRKDHFRFFSQFEEPFFGVTVAIDCTLAYRKAREAGSSFFLYYLHKSLVAANSIEAFRYRIEKDEVIVYEKVNASPTINRENGSFGFAYMGYYPGFAEFSRHALAEMERVRSTPGLMPSMSADNVIHYSSIPWLNFTSLSHARAFGFGDSVPKISFGKMMVREDTRTMPVSIHVHHGLMDGYEVGQFVDKFQALLDAG
jgi:chloramphenicol O-acetyltransferase type A